jgi:diguanylate cyclase (GGDEF)-like protein
MGHWAGDELLRAVAGRIERCLRGTDLLARFGTEKALARFGGDEFTILLMGVRDEEDAVRVVRRVLEELGKPFHFRGQEVYTTASAGISFVDASSDDPSKLLRNADIAMYRAKAEGRAGYAIFDETMHENAVRRLELETALRQALQRDQLLLHYQPVISLGTGNIVGFEALVRWQHPQRGLISPADFVPLAEETGLINPIGEWVLREACGQLKAWQRAFPHRDLSMAVNISSKQFGQQDLASLVRSTLAETNLAPRSLKLEITESVLLDNNETFRETLAQLHQQGVALHMDDFGTGYSSLSYLHQVPFETLKIDRSFINNMADGQRSVELVCSIVELARALGMNTTAEGVETNEQLSWLRNRKCQHAQGFLFSKPVPAPKARRLIEQDPIWS